jgi:deoxyribose-phosphate aldolase
VVPGGHAAEIAFTYGDDFVQVNTGFQPTVTAARTPTRILAAAVLKRLSAPAAAPQP